MVKCLSIVQFSCLPGPPCHRGLWVRASLGNPARVHPPGRISCSPLPPRHFSCCRDASNPVLCQAVLGMDILSQAKSGMGKTAVFVLATLQQIEPVDGQVGQKNYLSRVEDGPLSVPGLRAGDVPHQGARLPDQQGVRAIQQVPPRRQGRAGIAFSGEFNFPLRSVSSSAGCRSLRTSRSLSPTVPTSWWALQAGSWPSSGETMLADCFWKFKIDCRWKLGEIILDFVRAKKLPLKNLKHFVLDECDKMLEQLGG